jgi:hypothetical protein
LRNRGACFNVTILVWRKYATIYWVASRRRQWHFMLGFEVFSKTSLCLLISTWLRFWPETVLSFYAVYLCETDPLNIRISRWYKCELISCSEEFYLYLQVGMLKFRNVLLLKQVFWCWRYYYSLSLLLPCWLFPNSGI